MARVQVLYPSHVTIAKDGGYAPSITFNLHMRGINERLIYPYTLTGRLQEKELEKAQKLNILSYAFVK